MNRQLTGARSALAVAAFALASLAIACGGSGEDNDTPAATATATAAATSTGTPAAPVATSTQFVQSTDSTGPGVWQLGESGSTLAIGVLCRELGGGVNLDVNSAGRRQASALGGKFAGLTRQGVWIITLAPESARALRTVPPSEVAGRTLVARLDPNLALENGDPFLTCS